MTTDYDEFLASKIVHADAHGFKVKERDIHPTLFPFQRACVTWALRLGRAALFQECGLGKTLQQVEWARHVAEHTGEKVLILAPLAVAYQTVEEAHKVDTRVKYVREQFAANSCEERIIITNYDMLSHFDASHFAGVVLDESSILKSYMGATKRRIVEAFANTPYKLCCTATPAPNDHMELGNHAELLGVMRSTEMLMRWFINDTMKVGTYRLKEHGRKDFWQWVTSWAVCIGKPGDMGYEDNGFALPPLNIIENQVKVDHTRAFEEGKLFLDGTLSATAMWKEKRATVKDRAELAREIVQSDTASPWIVWCDTNNEADELKRLLPEAIEVRGSDTIAQKERKLMAFTSGEARLIITKPDLAGFGLNWQHCHNQVFVGVTYSFEKTYQALRRSWRFGQKSPVNAYIIYAESEGNVLESIRRKQGDFEAMQKEMNEAMKANGTFGKNGKAARRVNMDIPSNVTIADSGRWQMHLGDCVGETKQLDDNSIHFSIHSPPFSNLYIYSDSVADMGNAKDNAEFLAHYAYLIRELHRVTMPGRLAAVHCKDLPKYAGRDGAAGLFDFPGELTREFEKAGWQYHSKVTIWKDPVIEQERTKNHGLLYKNFRLRSEVVRQGMPDYLLVFRKWEGVEGTESPVSVVHNGSELIQYVGDEALPPTDDGSAEQGEHYWRNLKVWQRYASPVWFDIRQTNVLNYTVARSNEDEKHICPLQLDVIERAIQLWTNPDELIFSPFAGIGSEGYVALKLGRRFVGVELKETYLNLAIRHLKQAEEESMQMDMFGEKASQ